MLCVFVYEGINTDHNLIVSTIIRKSDKILLKQNEILLFNDVAFIQE